MSNLEVWLIIILVIAVIASNLAVLKYSAKHKMPQFGKDNKHKSTTKAETDKAEKFGENNADKSTGAASSDKHNTDK